MSRWPCPECKSQFGRHRQRHECAPVMALDEYFATGSPHEGPVFEPVYRHLSLLDDVYVETVSVGIFFEADRTIAQLLADDEVGGVWLPGPASDRRCPDRKEGGPLW